MSERLCLLYSSGFGGFYYHKPIWNKDYFHCYLWYIWLVSAVTAPKPACYKCYPEGYRCPHMMWRESSPCCLCSARCSAIHFSHFTMPSSMGDSKVRQFYFFCTFIPFDAELLFFKKLQNLLFTSCRIYISIVHVMQAMPFDFWCKQIFLRSVGMPSSISK